MLIGGIDLSNLYYLSEEETKVDVSMIPLRENTRLNCYTVRLEDLDKLNESYTDAMYHISRYNNIDENEIAVSVRDTDLLFSNLNEQFDRIVIEPTYSDYYYSLMDTIQECIRTGNFYPLEEAEDPTPYYTTVKTIKNSKKIAKDKSKRLLKNRKFQLGVVGSIGAYKGYKYLKKNGSPVKSLKEKLAALKMAYHTYKGEYDKALETGYKNPSVLRRILEAIKRKINAILSKLNIRHRLIP